MAGKFTIPRTTYMGAGALKSAAEDICTLGKRALIVTGKSMIKQGHMETLTKILENGGGSPLDSAKAIGAMVTNPGKIADYNGSVITRALPSLAGQ